MTLKTLGMGIIKPNVFSKIAKSKKKTPGEEHFDTVYKLDKTGKKDKMIKSLNKKIRSNKKQKAGPKDMEEYHRIMTKGSKYSPKFFKDK
jgi:hypothetical protein